MAQGNYRHKETQLTTNIIPEERRGVVAAAVVGVAAVAVLVAFVVVVVVAVAVAVAFAVVVVVAVAVCCDRCG